MKSLIILIQQLRMMDMQDAKSMISTQYKVDAFLNFSSCVLCIGEALHQKPNRLLESELCYILAALHFLIILTE